MTWLEAAGWLAAFYAVVFAAIGIRLAAEVVMTRSEQRSTGRPPCPVSSQSRCRRRPHGRRHRGSDRTDPTWADFEDTERGSK